MAKTKILGKQWYDFGYGFLDDSLQAQMIVMIYVVSYFSKSFKLYKNMQYESAN